MSTSTPAANPLLRRYIPNQKKCESLLALASQAFHDADETALAVYNDAQEEFGVPQLTPAEELGLAHPRRPQLTRRLAREHRVAARLMRRERGPNLTEAERSELLASLHEWRLAIGCCFAHNRPWC